VTLQDYKGKLQGYKGKLQGYKGTGATREHYRTTREEVIGVVG